MRISCSIILFSIILFSIISFSDPREKRESKTDNKRRKYFQKVPITLAPKNIINRENSFYSSSLLPSQLQNPNKNNNVVGFDTKNLPKLLAPVRGAPSTGGPPCVEPTASPGGAARVGVVAVVLTADDPGRAGGAVERTAALSGAAALRGLHFGAGAGGGAQQGQQQACGRRVLRIR